MQSGRGGGDRTLIPGEDGLVVIGIARPGPVRAGDIGRQGERAGVLEGLREMLPGLIEAQGDAAIVVALDDFGGKPVGMPES